jgi:DNA polymerase-3 subunit chi
MRADLRVDFYVNSPEVLKTACQVVKKAVAAQLRVFVFSNDSARLDQFDKMLWTFESLAFVPHTRLNAANAAQTPVWLGTQALPDQLSTPAPSLLVNLSAQVPDWLGDNQHIERVIELVGMDEPSKQAGRERFKVYRASNLNPTTHDLAKT